ncbi:hypothetical protein ACHAPY_011406 [Fusarium culmorum]
MLPLRKLIHLWSNDRFVPGGHPVTHALPTSDKERKQRVLDIDQESTIFQDFRDGIAILSNAIEGLETTRRFNQDPDSFRGQTQEVLMSHDYLLLVHVLRLVFPEGMMSELRPRKRALEEGDSFDGREGKRQNTEHRSFLTPKGPGERMKQEHAGFFAAQKEPRQKQVFGLSGFSTQSPTPSGGFFRSLRGSQEPPSTVFGSSGFNTPTPSAGFFRSLRGSQEPPGTVFGSSSFSQSRVPADDLFRGGDQEPDTVFNSSGFSTQSPTSKLLESIKEGDGTGLKRKLPDPSKDSDIQSQASFTSAFSGVSLTNQKETPDRKRAKLA